MTIISVFSKRKRQNKIISIILINPKLQHRVAVPCTEGLMESEADFDGEDVLKLAAFNGIIECEPPNNKLGRFNGKARVYISYN